MRFKRIVPYFFTLSMFLSIGGTKPYSAKLNKGGQKDFEPKYQTSAIVKAKYDLNKQSIEYKVEQLINTYIDNAVSGTQRIIKSTQKYGYHKAVREELPGAPISKCGTLHCLYGQYLQLNRAMNQIGDTIQIIPNINNAHMATLSFKHQMNKLYNTPEYQNSIYQGHLYTNKTTYQTALNKYVNNNIKGKTDDIDSLRTLYTEKFTQTNYCATQLNPGSIIITSSGHAIMYLGQGNIQNKEFVPDPNGEAICCSYNKEHPAINLSHWDTKNTFTADIKNIATQKYFAQLKENQTKQY